MSNCIQMLYDYDLVIKSCRNKLICLKTSFYKNVNKKAGVNYMFEICMNKNIKEYMKNRIKTDASFR